MSNKGQSLVEFIIIIAVVVLAGILILTLFGGNINQMFTKSSQKVDTYKPFGQGVTPSSSPNSLVNSTPASTISVNGVNVDMNTDGSASFTYNGQNVSLSAESLSDMTTVIGTTGSNGTEVLISMVQDMIDEYKDDYAPADVPIQIMSGKSARTDNGGDKYAYGDAKLNLVTVKVGDSFKVFQNDSGGDLDPGVFILEYKADNGENDIKITDKDGNNVQISGFEDDNKSEIDDFKTYTDPLTGKFYIVGEGEDGAGGSGNDVLSAAGISPPQGLIDAASYCFDKDGKLKDKVWLLEFNPNEN